MKDSHQKLVLKPFSAENKPDNCHINALLEKEGASFKVVFELTAGLVDLKFPVFHPASAQRKDKLWEHTCFEIFVGQHGMTNYREINLSPAGDWNVYSFSGYREEMKQDNYFEALPFEVKIMSDQELKLEIKIDLKMLQDSSDIDVGLSAVLELNNGEKSYWAVNHPGVVPDFHAREGWIQNPT